MAIFDARIYTSAQNIDQVLATGLPTLLVFEKSVCEPCRSLTPTLIFFANGGEVDRVVGKVPKVTLGNHVAQVLKKTVR